MTPEQKLRYVLYFDVPRRMERFRDHLRIIGNLSAAREGTYDFLIGLLKNAEVFVGDYASVHKLSREEIGKAGGFSYKVGPGEQYPELILAKIEAACENEALAYLDLPFRTFWFEYSGDTTFTLDENWVREGMLLHEEFPGSYIRVQFLVPNPKKVDTQYLLSQARDLAQKGTDVRGLLANTMPISVDRISSVTGNAAEWMELWGFCRALALPKNTEWGVDRVNEGVKIKNKTGKEFWKVKRLIYVRKKGCGTDACSYSGKPLDWKHRWGVRGHWRKISALSLGKDRAGVYRVAGATWVVDHEKGAEGPFVEKTRLYRDQEVQDESRP